MRQLPGSCSSGGGGHNARPALPPFLPAAVQRAQRSSGAPRPSSGGCQRSAAAAGRDIGSLPL